MFIMLKLAFTTALVLSHWIPDVPQIIETDASDYAIMAIHSVRTPDGELHPIAFHLQTLGPAVEDKIIIILHQSKPGTCEYKPAQCYEWFEPLRYS
jgi:hypothetical protein